MNIVGLFSIATDGNIFDEPSSHQKRPLLARLYSIASRHGFHQVRLSGNDPTLARDHLLSVLEQLPEGIDFILETVFCQITSLLRVLIATMRGAGRAPASS